MPEKKKGFDKPPHYKWAAGHKRGCKCYTCRIWRRGQRTADLIDRLKDL